jgi:hypothetical protein
VRSIGYQQLGMCLMPFQKGNTLAKEATQHRWVALAGFGLIMKRMDKKE